MSQHSDSLKFILVVILAVGAGVSILWAVNIHADNTHKVERDASDAFFAGEHLLVTIPGATQPVSIDGKEMTFYWKNANTGMTFRATFPQRQVRFALLPDKPDPTCHFEYFSNAGKWLPGDWQKGVRYVVLSGEASILPTP